MHELKSADTAHAASMARLAQIKAETPSLAITPDQDARLHRMLSPCQYRCVRNLALNQGIQTSELGRISSTGNPSEAFRTAAEKLERVGLMAHCELLNVFNRHGQMTRRGFWTLHVVDSEKWRKADQRGANIAA